MFGTCPPETNALNKESSLSSGLPRAGCPGPWRRPPRAGQLFQNVCSGATWNTASDPPRANQPQDRPPALLSGAHFIRARRAPAEGTGKAHPHQAGFRGKTTHVPSKGDGHSVHHSRCGPSQGSLRLHLWLLHPTSIPGCSHYDPREYLRGTRWGLPASYRPSTDGIREKSAFS